MGEGQWTAACHFHGGDCEEAPSWAGRASRSHLHWPREHEERTACPFGQREPRGLVWSSTATAGQWGTSGSSPTAAQRGGRVWSRHADGVQWGYRGPSWLPRSPSVTDPQLGPWTPGAPIPHPCSDGASVLFTQLGDSASWFVLEAGSPGPWFLLSCQAVPSRLTPGWSRLWCRGAPRLAGSIFIPLNILWRVAAC